MCDLFGSWVKGPPKARRLKKQQLMYKLIFNVLKMSILSYMHGYFVCKPHECLSGEGVKTPGIGVTDSCGSSARIVKCSQSLSHFSSPMKFLKMSKFKLKESFQQWPTSVQRRDLETGCKTSPDNASARALTLGFTTSRILSSLLTLCSGLINLPSF